MTDKITLELTLNDLNMLDKHVDYCEETKELFDKLNDKLKEAYPNPKMTTESYGKFDTVSYNGKESCRTILLKAVVSFWI